MTGHLWIWHLVECPVCDVDKGTKCHAARWAERCGNEAGANAVCESRYRVWDRRRKYWRGQYGKLPELLYAARLRRLARLAKARG
jgi:hypothetical protein